MKKLLIMLVFAVVAMAASAQRGRVITLDADTIQGAETVTFAEFSTTGSYNSISIQMLCTQLGGTSDGTLTLYGSNDGTNFVFINGAADGGVVTASPKASLTGTDMNQITITTTLVPAWTVIGSPFRDWKVIGVGTSGDTTLVNNISVVLK
jgi:hypothetical protein